MSSSKAAEAVVESGETAETSDVAELIPSEPMRLIDARLEAARRGDPAAMEAVVLALLPRVRNLVRYLVRGDRDVDDVAQDALVKVMERLHSYRGDGRFESWVDGVVLRVTLVAMRKRSAEARRNTAGVDELMGHATYGLFERHVARRRAVQALDDVPDKQRHALVMHHVLGMSVPEISHELDVPAETVRSRLRLGMQRLRSLMSDSERMMHAASQGGGEVGR